MPKTKKKDSSSDSTSDEEVVDKIPPKKKKVDEDNEKVVDKDDEVAWSLGKLRRVTVSKFKGKTFVGVREYYSDAKTDEEKPTKKGVNLTLEQFEKLTALIPTIKETLKKME